VSKNDYGFTLPVFRVNENRATLCDCVFKRVQHVHKPVTEIGATGTLKAHTDFGLVPFAAYFWRPRFVFDAQRTPIDL
jgi:hypothetical protein